ncbi:MAG: UTRA domain-containing protein [Candidatus Dormibacteria bacterium]
MARYQVTRTTVRSASGLLKQEGMVVAEHGAGSFVRDPKADRRLVDARQVGTVALSASVDVDRTGSGPVKPFRLSAPIESAARRLPATPWISGLLQVEAGTAVLVQESVGYGAESIPALRRAWLHPRVEQDLGLTEADLDGQWLPDLLAIRGVAADGGEDVVEATMPPPDLKRVLAVPDGVPVLQLYRVMKQDDLVVALIEVHLPADLTTLVFPRPPLGR